MVTQTVFGEGPAKAAIMFVGEQPGDSEDRSGHPFVGPAGKVFDRALAEAGIQRSEVYVTNVVKHFKWSRDRGKLIDSTLAPHVLATVHPSSILRAQDDESRRSQLQAFIEDLRQVARVANKASTL